jgi:hypothetical protein
MFYYLLYITVYTFNQHGNFTIYFNILTLYGHEY